MNLYDKITSYHYSMYRPPLHELILQDHLETNKTYNLGLDIGCGTGRSTVALSKYCKNVIGIDPSMQMLENAKPNPKVEYRIYNRKNLEFQDQLFDIVTFAGSLYYAKSQHLLNETIRVTSKGSQILVYDFKIHLNNILQDLTNLPRDNFDIEYHYQENFSGLEIINLKKRYSQKEEVSLDISQKNLVHLILSSQEYYKELSKKFGDKNIEEAIHTALSNTGSNFRSKISASIYYTKYDRF